MTSEIIVSMHAVATSLLPNGLIVKTDVKISLNRLTVPTNNFTTLCFLGLGFFFFFSLTMILLGFLQSIKQVSDA